MRSTPVCRKSKRCLLKMILPSLSTWVRSLVRCRRASIFLVRHLCRKIFSRIPINKPLCKLVPCYLRLPTDGEEASSTPYRQTTKGAFFLKPYHAQEAPSSSTGYNPPDSLHPIIQEEVHARKVRHVLQCNKLPRKL